VKCLDAEQSLDHSNGSCSGNRSIYWYLDPIRRSSPDAAEERGEAGCDHKVSPEEGNALRERFLKSELASRAGIVGVEFRKEDVGKWKSFVESRAVDIFFVAGYAFYSSPCRGGYLEAITNSEIISRASSIGARCLEMIGITYASYQSLERSSALLLTTTIYLDIFTRDYIAIAMNPSKWDEYAWYVSSYL
jgi:hypothetical protein